MNLAESFGTAARVVAAGLTMVALSDAQSRDDFEARKRAAMAAHQQQLNGKIAATHPAGYATAPISCENLALPDAKPSDPTYSVHAVGSNSKLQITDGKTVNGMVTMNGGHATFFGGVGSSAIMVAAAEACVGQNPGPVAPTPAPQPVQVAVVPVEAAKPPVEINPDGSIVVHNVSNLKRGSPGDVTITLASDKNGNPIGVNFALAIKHTTAGVVDNETWSPFEAKAGHSLLGEIGGGITSGNSQEDARVFVCKPNTACFKVEDGPRTNNIGPEGHQVTPGLSVLKVRGDKEAAKFEIMRGTAGVLAGVLEQVKGAINAANADGKKAPTINIEAIERTEVALKGTAAKLGL